MYEVYMNQFFCPYTMYSAQQSMCQTGFGGTYLFQQSICQANSTDWYRRQIQQCCCTTFNSLDSRTNEYCFKKESWIEKMDKLIFPNDPIRDWVENEIERISRKYAQILEEY